MKKYAHVLGLSLAFSAALAGCGGSDHNDSDGATGAIPPVTTPPVTTPPVTTPPVTTPGTGSNGTSGICSGNSRVTNYDVFLPTVNGIAQSFASRNVQLYGQGNDNNQCISIAGSSSQADTTPGTFQAITTDNWNNIITYVDPAATSISGGIKLNQQLIATCKAGSDAFVHVAIANPQGSTSTFVGVNPIATIAKNTPMQAYECIPGATGTAVTTNTKSVLTVATNGTINVTDGTDNTAFSAVDAASLFSQAGYSANGNTRNWYLYQLPTDTGKTQVVVATAKKSNGTFGVVLFFAQ